MPEVLDSVVHTSVLPKDARRSVPVRLVAEQLGRVIDETRFGGISIETAVRGCLEAHGIQLPAGRTPELLADEIMLIVFADEVFDSEQAQATRAATTVLGQIFESGTIEATGWLRGLVITRGWDRFTLTGNACESCGINPECYGPGGGIRCLDTSGCGYQFCF